MKQLTLYHGSNYLFDVIDLSKSRDRRDFGKGFYTTTLREQAASWAKIKIYYVNQWSLVNGIPTPIR
jgi:hypothetical protein